MELLLNEDIMYKTIKDLQENEDFKKYEKKAEQAFKFVQKTLNDNIMWGGLGLVGGMLGGMLIFSDKIAEMSNPVKSNLLMGTSIAFAGYGGIVFAAVDKNNRNLDKMYNMIKDEYIRNISIKEKMEQGQSEYTAIVNVDNELKALTFKEKSENNKIYDYLMENYKNVKGCHFTYKGFVEDYENKDKETDTYGYVEPDISEVTFQPRNIITEERLLRDEKEKNTESVKQVNVKEDVATNLSSECEGQCYIYDLDGVVEKSQILVSEVEADSSEIGL